ncbi:MAG: EAL domain-containing protein, partial [Cyanobacteria bacterium P01_H01_bin.153]
FPLGALKIDQSFTSNMQLGSVNQEIIETIVALSDRLGMVTIAEGGETFEQLQHLHRVGCEYSQGYYFCKPVPASALESLLKHPFPFTDKLPALR